MTDQDTPTPIRQPSRRSASRRRPSRTASDGGITGQLRAQLAEKASQTHTCPTCGNQSNSKAQIARDVGISVMSLNKFLKGGRVNSDTVDAVHAYLNR